MTTTNWVALASNLCGPHGVVTGCGRWALKAANGDVHLYDRESQAQASAPFYDSGVIDLRPCPVLDHDIPDIGYDREERRRERQARQGK